jgi:hypothetical protein
MSSGAFTDTFYESNKLGTIHTIRVQPATLALELGGQANAAPAGTEAIKPSAKVSSSKRDIGINARTVTIRLTANLAGYSAGATIKLPWLKPDTFDGIVPKATTGTYRGTACKVVGVSEETVV